MEERAAVSALDGLMERNCALIQEIEQDLARLTVALDHSDIEPDTMVMTVIIRTVYLSSQVCMRILKCCIRILF